MFKIGEYIVYGNSGVCKVEDIGTLDMGGISKHKLYYTLIPMYLKSSKVFTPVDNKKVTMRPIISEDNAWALLNDIDEMKTIDDILESGEKSRVEFYKESMKNCDCRVMLKIIKTLFLEKQLKIDEGKKPIASDDKIFKMAEDYLYGELAFSLKMDKDKVGDLVIARIESL